MRFEDASVNMRLRSEVNDHINAVHNIVHEFTIFDPSLNKTVSGIVHNVSKVLQTACIGKGI